MNETRSHCGGVERSADGYRRAAIAYRALDWTEAAGYSAGVDYGLPFAGPRRVTSCGIALPSKNCVAVDSTDRVRSHMFEHQAGVGSWPDDCRVRLDDRLAAAVFTSECNPSKLHEQQEYVLACRFRGPIVIRSVPTSALRNQQWKPPPRISSDFSRLSFGSSASSGSATNRLIGN